MSRITVTNLWTGEEREFEAELEYQSDYCTKYVGDLVTIEITTDRGGTVFTSREVEPTEDNDWEEHEEDEVFPFDVATMIVK